MQRLEVSGAVRPLYGSLGVEGLTKSRYLGKILEHYCPFLFKKSVILCSVCILSFSSMSTPYANTQP